MIEKNWTFGLRKLRKSQVFQKLFFPLLFFGGGVITDYDEVFFASYGIVGQPTLHNKSDLFVFLRKLR